MKKITFFLFIFLLALPSWAQGQQVQEQGQNDSNTSPAINYPVDREHLVRPMIEQVEELKIRTDIIELSSFKNRSYDTAEGVAAAQCLADHWRELSRERSDISVTFFDHEAWSSQQEAWVPRLEGWIQPSVIATIPGKTDDVIIVGGHLDSISYSSGENGRERLARAPGADDNASGVATFTEVFRILIENDYSPQNTIVFMAYAAEEVGLWGSMQIARTYRNNNVNVLGVMQLDMTNFRGSDTVVNILGDDTDPQQNVLLEQLIETYLPVPWGYTRCGQPCSDHYSWTYHGYPAVHVAEAKVADINKAYHTERDTIEISGGHAHHATNFAKLALAYVIELDR